MRRRWGRRKSPRRRIFNFENFHGVVALSVESTPIVRGSRGGARGGQQAPTIGGVENGEGKQESMGMGENACVFNEEDGEEMPSQVSNSDSKLLFRRRFRARCINL